MAKPDTTHECPAIACTTRVPRSQLACRAHWYRVSPVTRREVNAAWRSGDMDRYLQVRADAIQEMNR